MGLQSSGEIFLMCGVGLTLFLLVLTLSLEDLFLMLPVGFFAALVNVGDLAFISRIVFGHLSQNSSHALAQFFLQVRHIL